MWNVLGGVLLTVLLPVGAGEAVGEQAVHGVAQVVQKRFWGGITPPGFRHPLWIFCQVIPGVLDSFWKLLLEHLDAHVDASSTTLKIPQVVGGSTGVPSGTTNLLNQVKTFTRVTMKVISCVFVASKTGLSSNELQRL